MSLRTLPFAITLAALIPQTASAFIFSCDVSATDMAFGRYSGGEVTSTGGITVACNGTGSGDGNRYIVTLSRGSSLTYLDRKLRSGLRSLSYNLYTDPAHTRVWGDGGGGTDVVARTMNFRGAFGEVSQTSTVYGKIPAQPLPRGGIYLDVIVAVVVF